MKLHTKYWLKAIISPTTWVRLGKTDPTWDKFLWTALNLNKIELVGRYEAIIDGAIVWIENEGYGDGRGFLDGEKTKVYCSRATALYLRDQLITARLIQRLKGPFNSKKIWMETDINIS